jgi:hypothetical protein
MKHTYVILILLFTFNLSTQAQTKVKLNQNFENLEKGTDLLTLAKGKFGGWGKSTWTVTEKKGKGFNNSNKFATSGDVANANLVKYTNLEIGATYVFSVAVKLTNTSGQSWKNNYSVKAFSGKGKDDTHMYAKNDVKAGKDNIWKKHNLEFTVIKGRENVVLQAYRKTKGVLLHVDDFKLVKK